MPWREMEENDNGTFKGGVMYVCVHVRICVMG